MLRGRGLRTINALPPPPPPSRNALVGSRFEPPRRPLYKRLTGPVWHVPGFEQLALLEPDRS
jgi:hypothetical protein